MVQLTLAPVRNENLFTKHYLEKRLRNLPEWEEEDEIEDAFDEIKDIYERKKKILSSCNESQLRNEFINPVLEVLGFHLGVEAPVQHSAKQPDYALFENVNDKLEAYQKDKSEDFYQKSVAVADAKAWGIDFDKKTGEENVFENRNPSFQIYYYLDSTPPEWGFLTNGKKWRLYYEEIGLSQWFETYYEINLIDIIEKDDLEGFKYFYLFFRKQAFTPVGDSFLDQAYQGSERYAQEIGENLEDNVYKALRWMAKGYFDMGTNDLEKNRKNVEKVHEKSLIFLYRLIFLLYAESNGLLESGGEIPRKYSNYSVYEWAEKLLEKWDKDDLAETGGIEYHKLSEIFKLVREGSEKQGIPKEKFYIPAYNGGLFDNQKHPFFDKYKIQDGNLAKVVDLLLRTYSEEAGEKVWVDYSDLSLRHLGGIYEGLLEHQLRKADQKLVAEGDSKTGKWIPASEASKDFSKFDKENRKWKGELYLQTDKGERKATGSYYTPDYIVKYIVENAVGPVIEEKLEDAETDEENRQAILSTNVLDPAMGSGHFLVEAIDFLASRLVEFVENGGEERDIDWAKRKVARNCIYGVDINPLATELAKVSLWLNTMAEDKPLSFLDHHLKTGNSLIGADLHKLDKHPEELEKTESKQKTKQQTLYGKSFQDNIKELLSLLKDIGEVKEESPDDIKEQEQLLQEFESHPFKKKFDVLADVQTSYYFGNEFSRKDYSKLLDVFRVEDLDDIVWEKLSQTEHVKKASDSVPEKREDNLSEEKNFFYWKLEFPEVFFDIEKGKERDNPGFDAVIGNPPYRTEALGSGQEKADKEVLDYLRDRYPKASEYKSNLFPMFLDLSNDLRTDNGYASMIIPDTILTNHYFAKYRTKVLKNYSVIDIVDIQTRVFSDAVTGGTTILTTSGKSIGKTSVTEMGEKGSYKEREAISQSKFLEIEDKKFILSKEKVNLLIELKSRAEKLENDVKFYQGIITGDNERFLTDEKTTKKHRKVVRGRDIDRHHISWGGKYVLFDKERLWSNTNEEMFEKSPKIMIRQTADRIIAGVDRESFYSLDSTHLILSDTLDMFSLSAILNSKLLNAYYQIIVPEKGRTFSQVKTVNVGKLPLIQVEEKQDELENLEKEASEKTSKKSKINLKVKDYLGNYSDGDSLGKLYIPISGVADTVLTDTKVDKNNLKLGRIEFDKKDEELILKASAKFKPEDEDEFEDLDRWGYTETDLIPAMRFSGSEVELALIREFTKLAVDEAGGFANFREKATKTKSLIDRLKKLTLPKLKDVKSDLEKYLEQKEKAERLEEEIQETDNLIDAIVFDLYDLNEEEVEVVLDSLDTEKEVKKDILDKFREVNN